jgi:O-acetyl-ADP-ribose deacetylase (regulator of RNase III)/uncharacterized protein YwgA
MIRVLVGDLLASEAQTLVNTVNCVGIMGKGIALEFKKRFPEMYQDYVGRCARHEVRLGEPYLYRSLFPPCIINFPTKDHWRSVSRLDDIVAGLDFLEKRYQEWGVTSLAVPPLGCGQGQLEWRVVGPILYRHLSRFSIPIDLYAPIGTPDHELADGFLHQGEALPQTLLETSEPARIAPSWVALASIVSHINQADYHWPVGRTRFQKLTYFATAAGLPTEIEFRPASYGPFAPTIKLVLTKLVNNGLLVEEVDGKAFVLRAGSTLDDAINSTFYKPSLDEWRPIISRVTDLLLRIPARDTELVATIHYVWHMLATSSVKRVPEQLVVDGVKEWKRNRTPHFDDTEILDAVRNLDALGWIATELDASSLDEDDRLLLEM